MAVTEVTIWPDMCQMTQVTSGELVLCHITVTQMQPESMTSWVREKRLEVV